MKVVTFDSEAAARNYVRATGLTWPLLLDTAKAQFAAYGMTRGSWWSIYSPASIWKYLRLMAKGQKPGRPGEDWRQLGGDILIDPDRIIRMHHLSESPHDRPSVQSILDTVRRATSDSAH